MPRINELIEATKTINTARVFEKIEGNQMLIRLKPDAELKSHTSKVPAVLLCLEGKVKYQQEDLTVTLGPSDYVEIKPEVVHWLNSDVGCLCLLMK